MPQLDSRRHTLGENCAQKITITDHMSFVHDSGLKILQIAAVTVHQLRARGNLKHSFWSYGLFCDPWSNFHFIVPPNAQFLGNSRQAHSNAKVPCKENRFPMIREQLLGFK